jgi:HTH-type transcriptional regulator, competence development regulator
MTSPTSRAGEFSQKVDVDIKSTSPYNWNFRRGGRLMTLGQRIKELRRQHRFTQRQLAEEVGVDFTYLSKIENDRLEHTPSIKTLQDLAKALEVDELELMELANKVPPMLQAIARDKNALRFFRRATQTIKTSEGWRDLLAYLERQTQDR